MALNLMSLLSSAFGQEAPPEDTEGEEIVVNARRKKRDASKPINFPAAPDAPVLTNGPAPMDLGNRSMVEAARANQKNLPSHKSPLGVKGTLRDILGGLGDAFLIQSGNAPRYAPKRQQEKMADAMSGFSQNPMAAIERMAALPGGAEMAQKMYDDYESNQLKQVQGQSLIEQRNASADATRTKNVQLFSNYAARAMGKADTPAKQQAAYNLIAKQAKLLGVSLDDLGIRQDMTDDERQVLASTDMTVNQQEQLPRRDRQLDISEKQLGVAQQNAQSNRIRANRPPAGRSAPQPTNAAIAAPLLAKIQNGGTLTAGEKEVLTRTGFSEDRGRRSGRRTGGQSSGGQSSGKMVFRNGKFVPQ